MLLKQLQLKNIRSYIDQNIVFPEGRVLLSGDIGCGKSTILLAIEFALFGLTRDASSASLLRHGASEGSVALTLELQGKEYVIQRNLKRTSKTVKQETGFLEQDGLKQEYTPVELKTKILFLLGYPQELVSKAKSHVYRYTVYTPQEAMKHILQESNEERLNTLRRVFGVDKYKRISENTAVYMRKLKERVKFLEGKTIGIEPRKEELQQKQERLQELHYKKQTIGKEVEDAQGLVMQETSTLNMLDEKVKIAREVKNGLQRVLEKQQEKQKLVEEQHNSLSKSTEEITVLNNKIAAYATKLQNKPREALQKKVQEQEKQVQEVLQVQTEARTQHQTALARVQELEKELSKEIPFEEKRKEQQVLLVSLQGTENLLSDLEKYELQLHQLTKELQATELALQQATQLQQNILSLENCPTCLQEVKAEYKQAVQERETQKVHEHIQVQKQKQQALQACKQNILELKEKQKKIAETEKKLQTIIVELTLFEKQKKEREQKKTLLDVERKAVTDAEQQLQHVSSEHLVQLQQAKEESKSLLVLATSRDHALELVKEKTQAKQDKEKLMREAQQELILLADQRIHLEQEQKHFAQVEEKYAKKKELVEEYKESLKYLEISQATIDKESEGVQTGIQFIQEDIKAKEQAVQDKKNILMEQYWLESQFLPLIELLERQRMLVIHEHFYALFQEWFGMIVEDENLMVYLDQEFTPLVEQNGHATTLDALSGGEKTAVALAYRLSLNKVVNDVVSQLHTKDLIILDEPTDGFSTEQLDKVRDVLNVLGVKQTIIVSHESKVETFVDHVIRISKSQHVSSVV
jgi:DNA repair protein SbcC/Rad50